jgi:uncharacterized LabA/DUF88 family protein
VGKNVAVFVDVANIFYAAKAAGVDIDYVTLLKTASAGRDLVRAYAYTGLDPDNENQRNFHDFLRRNGYKVVSKDIRKYGDGKVKANLDIELVVDMMKTARNLDIAIVISGDGDFAPAIRAVQEMGIRVEVISFRGNTSSDLIEVADLFTEITQIARVEKGSSRSGRRVAGDEEDLSMTEVPDKQSEGTGARSRGRGRGRVRTPEIEPVAAAPVRARGRARVSPPAGEAGIAVTSDGMPLVAMPGEKLSRVAAAVAPPAPVAVDEEDESGEAGEAVEQAPDDGEGTGEEARRRRRRRGGRGRGRGRGREEGAAPMAGEAQMAGEAPVAGEDEEEDGRPEPIPAPAPAKRAGFAFGSVWDSQIGMPTSSAGAPPPTAPLRDEDDLDEPPIPEYLIAERRQRDGGRGGAGRGARGSYAAAMDRERFGGGRGASVNRFAEPAPRGRDDDRPRVDRPRNDRPRNDRPRNDRPAPRPAQRPAPRPMSGNEPWSEVPPEIEAMLRAQLSGRGSRPVQPARGPEAAPPASVHAEAPAPAAPAPRRRTGRVTPTSPDATVGPVEAVSTAPSADLKRRTTRKAAPSVEASAAPLAEPVAKAAAPKRRTAQRAAPATEPTAAAAAPAAAAAAPKRRATRKKADAPDA